MRQRAVICQDCWFWKEMSCALASPADNVCANKRPVQGRRTAASRRVAEQPALVPLASGHGLDARPSRLDPVAATPFATDAPEATFSMAQLHVDAAPLTAPFPEPAPMQPVRVTPPSYRDIRAGRAAAAGRAPVAEVLIPIEELESGTLVSDAATRRAEAPVPPMVGMEGLVERVRQRTAARISRGGALSPA